MLHSHRKYRTVRAALLASEPLCRWCRLDGFSVLAAEVDHIQPVALDGPMLDVSNLQPLCRVCHSKKSAMDLRAIRDAGDCRTKHDSETRGGGVKVNPKGRRKGRASACVRALSQRAWKKFVESLT